MTSLRSEMLRHQLQTAATKAERRNAVNAFMSEQPSVEDVREMTRRDSELRSWFRSAPQGAWYEARAAAEGTAASGGNLVPLGFADSVLRYLAEYQAIIADAESLITPYGEAWQRPQVSSFVASGSAASENSQLSDVTSTAVTFAGQQSFGQTPMYGALLRGSFQLLDDANVSLTDLLADSAAESIGRQLASVATTALYGAATAGQEISIGTVTVANVAKLFAKLDPAHLRGAKIYCSAGDYALLVADNSTNLRNLPVPVVPTGAATNFVTTTVSGPVLANLGNFLTMRRVGSMAVQVLNERYADLLQFGMLVYLRCDFQPTGRTNAAVFSH